MEPTTQATPPRRRRREETRERLLKSGFSVFARNGYDRATVDEIVRDAGFSKGAFYVHFNTKEDLFWAMLEDRATSMQQAFLLVLNPETPLQDNIRSLLTAVFSVEKRDPEWAATFMEFLAHAGRNAVVRERLAKIFESWHQFIADMLRVSRENGIVRSDLDIDFLARSAIALIEGTILQSRLSRDPRQLDDRVEPLCALLTELLEAR
jgi:TetR/AcrR family fatty acid metabolism transcriptional regulator